MLYYMVMNLQTQWTLFSIGGIPVRLNLSVVLMLFLIVSSMRGNFPLALYVCGVLLVSILLHELAHSGVAIAFGGRVMDITLQMLGGCARITRMPPKPWQECLMAAAGPASSFLIAAIAFVCSFFFPQFHEVGMTSEGETLYCAVPNTWLIIAAMLNFGLGAFNLVPAFPMDGGRVLRSLLQVFGKTKLQATKIAVLVGRGFAVIWAGVSLLDLLFGVQIPCPVSWDLAEYLWYLIFGGGGIILLAIAWMIWKAGKQELDMVTAESYYRGDWQ